MFHRINFKAKLALQRLVQLTEVAQDVDLVGTAPAGIVRADVVVEQRGGAVERDGTAAPPSLGVGQAAILASIVATLVPDGQDQGSDQHSNGHGNGNPRQHVAVGVGGCRLGRRPGHVPVASPIVAVRCGRGLVRPWPSARMVREAVEPKPHQARVVPGRGHEQLCKEVSQNPDHRPIDRVVGLGEDPSLPAAAAAIQFDEGQAHAGRGGVARGGAISFSSIILLVVGGGAWPVEGVLVGR